VSSQAARLAAAHRQRRCRARQRHGAVILEVEVKEHDVAGALIAVGWLEPQQALDKHEVEKAIAAMLNDWAAAWHK
jgi:hypothetical protein